MIKEKSGTYWSKSKSNRANVNYIHATDQFVGPGSYTVDKAGDVIPTSKLKESSVFASTVPRDRKKLLSSFKMRNATKSQTFSSNKSNTNKLSNKNYSYSEYDND